jgi:hypothetical protein
MVDDNWQCSDRDHPGDRSQLARGCGGCNIRRLVLADRREAEAPLGRNGGRACSTRIGPCDCGAWH